MTHCLVTGRAFNWTNNSGAQRTEDRGILLRDVLDDAVAVVDMLPVDEPRGAVKVLNVNPSGHGMNSAVMHVNGKSRTITTNRGEGPKIIAAVAAPDGYAMRQVGRSKSTNTRCKPHRRTIPQQCSSAKLFGYGM